MRRLLHLRTNYPVAHAVGILALVCAAGTALGSVKVRGAVPLPGLVATVIATAMALARWLSG